MQTRNGIRKGAFFMEFFMAKAKTIQCPECKRAIAHYDGKQQNNINALCRKCNKMIVYMPDTDNLVVRNRRERASSSGLTI